MNLIQQCQVESSQFEAITWCTGKKRVDYYFTVHPNMQLEDI